MNAQEPQDITADSSATLPKKPTRLLAHLLLILAILAGIACGYYIYAYRQHHLRTQQSDHSIQQTLNTVQENLRKNETDIDALRAQQSDLAKALQKIQTAPPVTVAPTESHPDISAAFEALSTLDSELDTLPLETPKPSTPTPSPSEAMDTWWSRFMHVLQPIWHQLVIVRHVGDEPAFMTPAVRQLVILRLHTDLDAAKWAVLHHDALVYKTALDNAHHTLGQYFSEDAAKPVLDHLAALINAGIPENPTAH